MCEPASRINMSGRETNMRKSAFGLWRALFLCSATLLPGQVANPQGKSHPSLLAATPPMGWNSWDGYGTTVKEVDVKANAQWLAEHLKLFGWQYVVVDMEWFVTNPIPEGNSKTSQYSIEGSGRYTPAVNRFPSAANDAGFKPLADYIHSLGLKFGIHILRGIPKLALEKNLPIAGSSFRAADAADSSDTCPWNFDNFGIDSSKREHKPITTQSLNSIPVGKWI
jgi:alpha-galactosidase